MTEHPAIAALRATAPSTANMLPWNGNHGRFCVRNAKDGLVADTFWPEDRDHIVAAVNAAPVMLAELGALRAHHGADPNEWPNDLRVQEFPPWPFLKETP